MTPLTKEQQDLVSKNHNLIYEIAIRKKWDIEEYYDILAIALCKAAQIYDKNKGEFSTVANQCMENEVYNYWRKLQRLHRVPSDKIVSYDTPAKNVYAKDSDCYNVLLSDLFIDNKDDYNVVIANEIFRELLNLLTEKEKQIALFCIYGFTQNEIALKLNSNQQNIFYQITKIRKKWKIYLDCNC